MSRAANECKVTRVREVNGAPNIHSLSLPEEAPALAAFAAVSKAFVFLLWNYWSRMPQTGKSAPRSPHPVTSEIQFPNVNFGYVL